MTVKSNFQKSKVIIGGIRSDSIPSTDDGDQVVLRLDSNNSLLTSLTGVDVDFSGGLTFIAVEHKRIHDGDHFFASDYETDLDTAQVKNWQIIAPNTSTRCHITWFFNSSLNGLLELYENPTLSTQGTQLSTFNNDRNSSATPTMTFFKDPTVTDPGTLLAVEYIGSAGSNPSGQEAVGVGVSRSKEIILKQDYHYLIRFTADSDNEETTITLEWYEV